MDKMGTIPDKPIDMILCDLPYGTTACKWDVIIPFDALWAQYKRVIKDNGAIVLFGTEPFSSQLRLSCLDLFRYDWIWEKRNFVNFAAAKKQPLKIHETISVFSKNQSVYNPQDLVYLGKTTRQGRKASQIINGQERPTEYFQEFTGYPKSVLVCSREDNQQHPTKKPVALLEYLIKTYTNEGETVLDNTMGSGSTGVACVNTGRYFIGIEKDEKYFEIAKNRIDDASKI